VTGSFVRTRVGHAEWGDNHFCGYSVARELAGQETWLGLVVLGVTGRRLRDDERAIMDDLAVVMSVADPRLWHLKVARLVSAYGGVLPALASGTIALEEACVGPWGTGDALRFLRSVRESVGGPEDLPGIEAACRSRLAQPRRIVGYGVPFRNVDERVVMLSDRIAARGREKLEYWTLFGHVSDVLFRLKGLKPNIWAAAAAACLDLGLDERQARTLITFLGLSDFLANAAEGATQAPVALRTIEAASVRYTGPAPRQSPRQRGSKGA
jgi:hypothetical protein